MSSRSSASTPHSAISRAALAPRGEREVVEQRRHRRVEPVALAELQRQALAQVAGADAGRVAGLHERQARGQGLGAARPVAASRPRRSGTRR